MNYREHVFGASASKRYRASFKAMVGFSAIALLGGTVAPAIAAEPEDVDTQARITDVLAETQEAEQTETENPALDATENTAIDPGQVEHYQVENNLPPMSRAVSDGGSGRHRDVIDWAQWGEPWRDIDNTSDVTWTTPTAAGDGFWISTRCEISDVVDKTPQYPIGYPQWQGDNPDGSNPKGPRNPLMSYTPGSWSGDALDELYNIGGTGHYNQLVNGIAVKEYTDDGLQRRYDVTVEFKFDCGAWLIAQSDSPTLTPQTPTTAFSPVPLAGLVFADAESNNWLPITSQFNGSQREYIAVTPSSDNQSETSWKLLDSYRTPECKTNSVAEFMNDGKTLRFRSDDVQCATADTALPYESKGPASVMFLNGATSATVEVRGGGQGAVALGAILSIDFGDAPESYGSAASLFQPTWDGGEITGSETINLSAMKDSDDVVHASTPKTILGNVIDGELKVMYSEGADADDNSGIDDEDGLSFVTDADGNNQVLPAASGENYVYSHEVACVGPGEVAAWIDWNRNGTFDANEKSTQVPCTQGSANLNWEISAEELVRSVSGEQGSDFTYMRVRITNETDANGAITQIPATGLTTVSGEVEDYRVEVRPDRTVELLIQKMIVPSDAPDGSIEGASAAGNEWEFSVPEESAWTGTDGVTAILSNSTTDVSGQVHPTVTIRGDLDKGKFAFTETQKPGYEVVPVNGSNAVCVDTVTGEELEMGEFVGDNAHPGFESEIAIGQSVKCTIYNKPNTHEVTWAKVAAGTNAELLGGSKWLLTPTVDGELDVSRQLEVEDCVETSAADCTGEDRDPEKGKFKVQGLLSGAYQLEELEAPPGYQLLDEPINIVINSHYDIGDIENSLAEAPVLPLTGGMGTFAIFLGAGGFGILVLLGLWLQRRRRQAVPN